MLLFVLLVGVTCAMAQRPMYAGSGPIGRPDLASRFKDTAETTTAGAELNNRFGEGANAGTNANLPVDALGDEDLVNRLNQWPREHRPFWLLNSAAIEEQRNKDVNRLMGMGQQGQNQGAAQAPQGGQVLGTRGNFDNFDDFGPTGGSEVPSLPIRPANQRPTFWGRN